VYRRAYFECRRGQLDMRTRIRGPKYADTLHEADARAAGLPPPSSSSSSSSA
jgi:hypothetical protein